MKCKNCGHEHKENSTMCRYCIDEDRKGNVTWCQCTNNQTEDKLDAIFRMQKFFAERIQGNGKFPEAQDKQVSALCTAIIHEAVELQSLTSWKWWKTNTKPMDLYHAREELIDIFHFVIHAALVLDMTPQMFLDTYKQKMEINHKRQDNGY